MSGSPPALGAGHLVSSNLTSPTKCCINCKISKPLSEFHTGHSGGHFSWCKPCRREWDAAYWQKNRIKRREQTKRVQEKFRDWYRSLKENPCADCSQSYPHYVMQWDHKDGTKVSNLADLVKRGNKQLILDEITKCDLICGNCHLTRTWQCNSGMWRSLVAH